MMMFSNKDLRKLLIPLMLEQILTSFMGTIDTMMVANLGQASVSGVSCVDSINKLFLFLFASIATGGTIICSQFIGKGDKENTDNAARQVLLCSVVISLLVMAICMILQKQLLLWIFGSVEADVMTAANDYFFVTLISYPFTSVFNVGAAIYRAQGNSKLPLIVSAACNVLNIIGNYILLFVVKTGVAGAAWSTTASMFVASIVIIILLERKGQLICLGNLLKIRPDMKLMSKIIKVGVPSGIENSMFQLGKLVVQSTVSTLGTTAIAANALVVSIEYITSMPSTGIGVGLVTVAGQALGAGKLDEAKLYIRKLTKWGAAVLFIWNWLIFALVLPICHMSGLDSETTDLVFLVMLIVSIVKPFLWPLSFIPPNGMRAAGDATFMMVTATVSMWVCRVALTTLLCRVLNCGLVGIWCGYFADWLTRDVINVLRYASGKWHRHKVI